MEIYGVPLEQLASWGPWATSGLLVCLMIGRALAGWLRRERPLSRETQEILHMLGRVEEWTVGRADKNAIETVDKRLMIHTEVAVIWASSGNQIQQCIPEQEQKLIRRRAAQTLAEVKDRTARKQLAQALWPGQQPPKGPG